MAETTQPQGSKIPDKLYFKIGEVAKILGLEPYVLRYWETEFPEISPVKSKSRQRLYRRQDVELISQIRDLLYRQNFTIKGAKKKVKDLKKAPSTISREQMPLGIVAKSNNESVPVEALQCIIEEMDEYILS
jgi:DNA-binding transcriptional MerR regulator